MDLQEKVFEQIRSSGMIRPGERIVAGVSGGADSVCMLHMLKAWQKVVSFELICVHVEHGVRGEESLEDAAFVRRLCGNLSLPCHVIHVDMKAAAAERGMSPEEAGRTLRYEVFYRFLSEKEGKISVAHHSGDQAETVLLHMARGCGLHGLGGMRPVNGRIIRPMLTVSREEIEQWLRENRIPWRTDQTNEDVCYTRNRIRHRILPVFQASVNERTIEHICFAAEKAAQADAYLRREADRRFRELLIHSEEGTVALNSRLLSREDPLLQEYIVREAAETIRAGVKDFTALHWEALCALAGRAGKKLDLPGMLQARERDGCLIISRRTGKKEKRERAGADHAAPCFLERDGEYSYGGWVFSVERKTLHSGQDTAGMPASLLNPEENRYTKWLSCDTMNHTLCLRNREPGDYLVINALGQRKSLRRYLIDEKVPAGRRDSLVLLADGSHILWVVGWRISEACKVNEQTSAVLKISAGPALDRAPAVFLTNEQKETVSSDAESEDLK